MSIVKLDLRGKKLLVTISDRRQAMKTRISAIRDASGMSRKELASAIGVSYSVLAKWETGQNAIALSQATAIARVLGCTLTELVGDDAPQHDKRFDELAGLYRSISEDGRAALLASARGLAAAYPGEAPQAGMRSA
jgi:transcriptional regulator with XRE-family HTH domain